MIPVTRESAQILQAYFNSPPGIQEVIRDMVAIIFDLSTPQEDVQVSLNSLREALFPTYSSVDGKYGIDLQDEEDHASGDERAILQDLDREQKYFADRVNIILNQRNLSYDDLAEKIHLNRNSLYQLLSGTIRPATTTIYRIAEVLEVSPANLWPTGLTEKIP